MLSHMQLAMWILIYIYRRKYLHIYKFYNHIQACSHIKMNFIKCYFERSLDKPSQPKHQTNPQSTQSLNRMENVQLLGNHIKPRFTSIHRNKTMAELSESLKSLYKTVLLQIHVNISFL